MDRPTIWQYQPGSCRHYCAFFRTESYLEKRILSEHSFERLVEMVKAYEMYSVLLQRGVKVIVCNRNQEREQEPDALFRV